MNLSHSAARRAKKERPNPPLHPPLPRAGERSFDHGNKQPESVYRDAMGCGWMTVEESREAVPPAYTEPIGSYLMAEAQRREKEAA